MMLMSVFAIIVLGFLGLSMSRLLGASSTSVVYEVYGLHALNAARSGLDAQVRRVFATQQSDASQCDAVGNMRTTQEFLTIEGMETCRAISLCTVTQVDGTNYFRFESQGICELPQENIVVSRTLAIDGRDVQL